MGVVSHDLEEGSHDKRQSIDLGKTPKGRPVQE